MADVTDRQALDLRVKATIEFEFGSICDEVTRLVEAGRISPQIGDVLKRVIRNRGNNGIRVITNHLDYYNVSRNHRKDSPNIPRAVNRALKG